MIYFTSDLHIGHEYVSQLRRFSDVTHHDKKILNNINSVVGKTDELYVLGDVSSGSPDCTEYACEVLSHLNIPAKRCHLVLGNHEKFKIPMRLGSSIFGTSSIHEYVEYKKYRFILSHVPLSTSNVVSKNKASNSERYSDSKYSVKRLPVATVHLHGHTHSNDVFDCDNGLDVNVGLDAWNLHPVSVEQIIRELWSYRKVNS